MRKLKLQMQLSVDGFAAAGPNDEQEWVTWALDEIAPHVLQLFDSTDTIIIGRKLAVDYIPYWQETFKKPQDPMHAFAERIVAAKKVVFTKTLNRSEWENTELATGDLTTEIQRLKSLPGKDLVVYGGCELVAGLIAGNLIDEYHFFINPVALGTGIPIFQQLNSIQRLKLVKAEAYPSGIALLQYTRAV